MCSKDGNIKYTQMHYFIIKTINQIMSKLNIALIKM